MRHGVYGKSLTGGCGHGRFLNALYFTMQSSPLPDFMSAKKQKLDKDANGGKGLSIVMVRNEAKLRRWLKSKKGKSIVAKIVKRRRFDIE